MVPLKQYLEDAQTPSGGMQPLGHETRADEVRTDWLACHYNHKPPNARLGHLVNSYLTGFGPSGSSLFLHQAPGECRDEKKKKKQIIDLICGSLIADTHL